MGKTGWICWRSWRFTDLKMGKTWGEMGITRVVVGITLWGVC